LRLIGGGGTLRTIARIHIAGDPAQSARGVTRRDGRQTTVRGAANRTGVQTRLLRRRLGADVGRTVRVASRAGLPSTPRGRCRLPDGTRVRASRQLRRLSFDIRQSSSRNRHRHQPSYYINPGPRNIRNIVDGRRQTQETRVFDRFFIGLDGALRGNYTPS